jgi:dihydrofolate reductase
MRKVNMFNFVTLNGYFKGLNEDISWHKHDNEEENQFAAESMESESIILFGRVTYEMMAASWTSPRMKESNPKVAEGMNKSEKIVFSKTLKKADWQNTRLINDDMIEAVKKLKRDAHKDMIILGSGSIVTQLAEHDLIDTYQIMVDPVVLKDGTSIFKNISKQLNLKLRDSRPFKKSGAVLLTYERN